MLQPGVRAPAFCLPRLQDAPTDPAVERLKDVVTGGAAFLVFAKPGCPTCQYLAGFLGRLGSPETRHGVAIRLILQSSPSEAAEFQGEWRPGVPVLLDPDPFLASEAFGIRYVPSGFLVDRAGRIENSFESFVRSELEEIYEKICRQEGRPTGRLFSFDERVPSFRPG